MVKRVTSWPVALSQIHPVYEEVSHSPVPLVLSSHFLSVCSLCVFSLGFLSVFSFCVFSLCVLSAFSFCVFCVCVCACFLYLFSFCVLHFCVCFVSVCFFVCVFSLCFFSLCIFCLCLLPLCLMRFCGFPNYSKQYICKYNLEGLVGSYYVQRDAVRLLVICWPVNSLLQKTLPCYFGRSGYPASSFVIQHGRVVLE